MPPHGACRARHGKQQPGDTGQRGMAPVSPVPRVPQWGHREDRSM